MPLPNLPGPLPRRLLREQVYAALRQWIVQGVLRPGEQLRDTELAARLGVSRTPVREALRRLEDEGLVQAAAHRWTRVAPLDPGDAQRIYPLVIALEVLAARLAAPLLGPADLQAMADANLELDEALRARDATRAAAADRAFHAVFVERAGNPELSRVLHGLKTKLERLEAAYFGDALAGERSVAEHEAILRAFHRGDAAAAARAVRANWTHSLRRLEARLRARPAPGGRGRPDTGQGGRGG